MSFSPSHAARRIECPASRIAETQYREYEKSQAAQEGIAVHYLAEQIIKFGACNTDFAPNGELLTQEMHNAAAVYINDIAQTVGKDAPFYDLPGLYVESRIHIPIVNNCVGYPDAFYFNNGKLTIWDFKYGHRFVDPYENWQLIYYAAGILKFLNINGLDDQFINITFKIVQPRCYYKSQINTWEINAAALRAYFNKAEAAEIKTFEKNKPAFKPSSQCFFCSARRACPALQNAALMIAEKEYSEGTQELSEKELGAELKYLESAAQLLESRLSGLREQATSAIKKGRLVPGFSLVEANGREIWDKPIEEIISVGELLGVELKKPTELITPKQAVTAGLNAGLVKQYSKVTPGALKLVQDDSAKIKDIFKNN